MADTVKSRKRSLKSVYVDNDSDDDFSDPVPAQPKSSKMNKKKAVTTKEKVTVYTSTQGLEKSSNGSPAGRKSRVSAEELRFQRELEEALKISTNDDTTSSAEIVSVCKKEENSSTFDTIPYVSSDGENKENEVSSSCGSNTEVNNENAAFSAGLSEKEMGPGLNKLKEDVVMKEEEEFEHKKSKQSPVKKFEAKTKKKDAWIVADDKDKVVKKGLDSSTDDEAVRKDIRVIAQVHKSDAGSDCEKTRRTSKTLQPITEDSEEEDFKIKASSSSKKKRAKKIDSDDDYDCNMDTVVNSKRKRKSRKLESDDEFEDQDFGAEEIMEVNDSEAEDSEDEYKPAKKKQQKAKKASPKTKTKTPPAKKGAAGKKDETKTETTAAKKEFTSVKQKSGMESKSSAVAAAKPSPTASKPTGPAAIKPSPILSKLPASPALVNSSKVTAAVSSKSSKVSSPLASAPATPILSKPKPSPIGSFSKVKIPSWTPPAKVGTGSNSVSSKTPNTLGISPGTGPRLGLSRKMRVLKPLHACVKNTQ